MSAAVLTGAGAALPATLDQDAAWDGFFAQHYEGVRAARRIFAGAGVRTRHAVANPIDEDVSGWGTGARMARYIQEALPLGKQAVAGALDDAGLAPGDVGLFVLFFLNYVKLEVGEAMFLKADDIHAYLSGDIIECMAASDNVVRAGFTPKFKDVDTLVSMLTYSYAPISEQKMEPADYPYATLNASAYSSGSQAILYDPPIDEFSVVKTDLKKKGAKATFEQIAGPSIFICTSGEGKISVGPKVEEVKSGYVYFVGATAEGRGRTAEGPGAVHAQVGA